MELDIEDALRAAVKQSVAKIAKGLVGDKKSEVLPLFAVTLVLDKNQRIELKPTVQVQPSLASLLCQSRLLGAQSDIQVQLAFVALSASVSQASRGCCLVTAVFDEGGSRSWPNGFDVLKETQ